MQEKVCKTGGTETPTENGVSQTEWCHCGSHSSVVLSIGQN